MADNIEGYTEDELYKLSESDKQKIKNNLLKNKNKIFLPVKQKNKEPFWLRVIKLFI